MYTAYIGRRLLDLYNAHRNPGPLLSPRQFFDDVFFPLFFDDERYLMLAGNSKLGQLINSRGRRRAKLEEELAVVTEEVWAVQEKADRLQALGELHDAAADLNEPHMHLVLGGYAADLTKATSSQVTDIAFPISPDEVYLSWLGTAAGVGVKGGLSMLIDADAVLLALLDGWVQYRDFLHKTPHLKPYQVDTWNGWWLVHRFGNRFKPDAPLRDFPTQPEAKPGQPAAFETPPWARVLFALAQAEAREQTSYVYSFGQTNTTIGFVQLALGEVQRYRTLLHRLFGEKAWLKNRDLEALYDTHFVFITACQQGQIGLRAIEPDKLRDYMPGGQRSKLPTAPKDEDTEIRYAFYQTWIIAMLNNEKLLAFARQAADAFHQYTATAAKGKTNLKREVEQTLEATTPRAFIDGLTGIVKNDGTHAATFKTLVEEIVKMPSNDFPLLLTLIRFYHALPH